MHTQSAEPDPAGPLHGITVLDLTSIVLGPIATQVLGDYGADVLKVESPEGDLMRANGVSRHPGMSSIFLTINRNKRSIVIDLKKEEGRLLLLDLVGQADVLVHNMRVSAITRLGIDYQTVKAVKPDIVYCAATGFGQDGPYHAHPAFDDIVQAASGLAGLMRDQTGAPSFFPALIADKTAGMAVVNAVLAALFHRARTGEGQYVEVPMFETLVEFNIAEHLAGIAFEPPLGPAGYARITNGGRKPLRSSDGYLAILPYSPDHWIRLLKRLDREDLIAKYDLSDRHKLNQNVRALYQELAEMTPGRTTEEWISTCEALDVPVTPIYSLDELLDHPHLKAVEMFKTLEHPSEGTIRYARPAVRFAASPASVRCAAPSLGEHSCSILEEFGFSTARIAQYAADGIIGTNNENK